MFAQYPLRGVGTKDLKIYIKAKNSRVLTFDAYQLTVIQFVCLTHMLLDEMTYSGQSEFLAPLF